MFETILKANVSNILDMGGQESMKIRGRGVTRRVLGRI
jgi:hypothetical protein